MLFFLGVLMNPINATKTEFMTENKLIDVIVAYSNVDQNLVQDKGLSYTDLKYSEEDIKYFEGLIKQLMECYSKSTSDFTIEGRSSEDADGNVITSRIFYFGFTNADMDDYYSGESSSLSFLDIVGTKEVKEYLEGYEGQEWAELSPKLESDFPIDRTLASSPNKVCTFAFLIFEDLSFSIIAFNNCNNDPLRKPLTGSDYAVIDTNLKQFESDLKSGRIIAISNLDNENQKELAILALKINTYLRYVLFRNQRAPDSVCNDFLKASTNDQSSQSSQTTSSSDNNRCDPKTNPCCKDDGTLKAIGDECFDSSIISDCLTHCIGIKYKSACQENENQELECSLTTIPIDDNLNSVVYAPRNTICNENSDGTSSFVLVSSSNHCYSSLGCEQEQPLTAYYGCDGQGSCSVATFQPIGSVCSGETPNCCNGVCVNYENDHLNCGDCGKSCSSGEFCNGGRCEEIDPNSYCISTTGQLFCPDNCKDYLRYYNGVCGTNNMCKYDSDEVDCCSTPDCINEGDNFKCVGYKCICIPFDNAELDIKCANLECGNIPDGCGRFFSCGKCDDNNPCTKDSCNPNNNKCEYEPISCDDGKQCVEGECVLVDSLGEGDSVVDDTSSEDLVENKDEEQSSSQPSEASECKIDFGAITKTPPSFCREWAGNFFGNFLLKRYNWYKDTNCPTKEYSYYSLLEEQSHLISYHCRDTCGGPSCGCDFVFGCEGCTENNGVILDCSKVQGSKCYTADENGKYVNQCNLECVKAVDCRSEDSRVTTGIDNSEGYKKLGCGYMPKGTSCVGENGMDGRCDGEGRCIVSTQGETISVPVEACSDTELDTSGSGIYLERNQEKPLSGKKIHYCFEFSADEKTVKDIQFMLETAGLDTKHYSDCNDLASLKLIHSENPILDDGQSIIVYFGDEANFDVVFSETNYDSFNYQKDYSLAEKFYLYFLSGSSFTGVTDFVSKSKELLKTEETSYYNDKRVSLLNSRANLHSVFDSVNSSRYCNIINTESSTDSLKNYIIGLGTEGNFIASKYIFGCLLDASLNSKDFASSGNNLPLFVDANSPPFIDAYNNFFMAFDITKPQNKFINNFYSSIQKLMHGNTNFHYKVDIVNRNDNYVSKIFVKQTQEGGIITKEAPRIKINIGSSGQVNCGETYSKVTDILAVLFEKDFYDFPQSIKPLGFSDSNNKEPNKKIIRLMHTSFFSYYPLDSNVAEVFADSLVEYSLLYGLNPYAALALLHTEGMNPYSVRYEPHRDIIEYDKHFFNMEYPSKSQDFTGSFEYDYFKERNENLLSSLSKKYFRQIYPESIYPSEKVDEYFYYSDRNKQLSIQEVVNNNKNIYSSNHLLIIYGKFTTLPDINSDDPWKRDLVNYQEYASQIPALYYAYSSYGLSQIMPQTCVDAKKYLTNKQLNPSNSNDYPLCECTKSKLLFTGQNNDVIKNQVACGLQAMYYKIESAKVNNYQAVPDTAGELGVAYKYGSLKKEQVNSDGVLLENPKFYTIVPFQTIRSIDKKHYVGLGLANSQIQYATS